ncbi:MAG: dipeptidyl-peptidase 3 family protein [Chlorobiota bacterium]
MKKNFTILLLASVIILTSCSKEEEVQEFNTQDTNLEMVKERIKAYSPTKITADISDLTVNQKKVVEYLVRAGKVSDEIFWMQNTPDAISIRDSLANSDSESSDVYLEYVKINYGPYDEIYGGERFVGDGPSVRPAGGNFYPTDLSKVDFENYISENPDVKDAFTSLYTVIKDQDSVLKAIPYHEAYADKVEELASYLEKAAEYADNPSLKSYLELRAKAVRTDEYYESDMAWMDLTGNDIDVVIGPIESYADKLLGYKTSYESIVMIRDKKASEQLEMFESNIDVFESKLPYDKKYIRMTAGKGTVLQVVNVAYFGGHGQQGTKTIAASLPNDPRVHKQKGAKKSMFKNMMEAKFDQIVKPIGDVILEPSLRKYVDQEAFTSFVTLHEVSHTLGRGYVYGKKDVTVSSVLKERYSALEECKADIVGMWNISVMHELGLIDDEYVKKSKATFVAGLYRSIRFGSEKAHGKGNLIQLNFLMDKGAITTNEDGTLGINDEIFFDVVGELAGKVLTIQAEGNYEEAGNLFKDYGVVKPRIEENIEKLKDIPRDLNTTYDF